MALPLSDEIHDIAGIAEYPEEIDVMDATRNDYLVLQTQIVMKNERSGWIAFRSFTSRNLLYNSFTLPLYYVRSYSVEGSCDDDIRIPEEQHKVRRSMIHIEGDGRIEIESVKNLEDCSTNLTIDFHDQIYWNVEYDVQFGPHSYVVCMAAPVNTSFNQTLSTIALCSRCDRNARSDVKDFSCGHMLCSNCFESHQQSNRCKHCKSFYEIICRRCRVRHSIADLLGAKTYQHVPTICEIMWYMHSFAPKVECSYCKSARCTAVEIADYYYCNSCRETCCPLCILDMHAYHDVQSIYCGMKERQVIFDKKRIPLKSRYNKIPFIEKLEQGFHEFNESFVWLMSEIEKYRDRLAILVAEAKDRHSECVFSLAESNANVEQTLNNLTELRAIILTIPEPLDTIRNDLVARTGKICQFVRKLDEATYEIEHDHR